MYRRLVAAILLGVSFVFGQPLSQIDTVQVTPVFLKLVDNSGGVYKYRGKVSYRIIGWAYDRFNVTVSIIQDGTGAVVPLTMVKGDVGQIAWQGDKSVHFACQFNSAPSGTYKAKVSIVPSQSDTAVFLENKIAAMSNADKQTIVNGGSAAGVVGLNWRDGPYGLGGTWSFPTGLAMAATWDTAIIEEGGYFMGMSFRGHDYNVQLGPSCNLCRDSRAGRTTESYGEDPFVNGKDATAAVEGVQRGGTIPTLKHYCCNNVERARGFYPVHVSERGLRELYTYHFGMASHDGGCAGIMVAYNSVNGVHNAQNKHTMTDILKNFWGLKGFILTDWDNGGTSDNAKRALAGLDLPTPGTWGGGLAALVPGTITQGFFDDKARRSLWARYKTGCFDAGYTRTKYADSINSTNMINYARRVSRECYILLKNDDNLLPLDKTSPITIAMVGPWANQIRCGPVGSAQNCPSKHYTAPTAAVKQIGGSNVTVTSNYSTADYVVVCIGPNDQGEGFDRNEVSLPDTQDQLVGRVLAAKPGRTIVWYTGGSTADTGNWNKANAILMSSYPGEDHALALAECLFGDYNPGGKLPLTFPLDSTQLPRFGVNTPWADSGDPYEPVWEGRGYPYYDYHHLTPLFCFGYGLSYTTFSYSNLHISPNGGYPGDTFAVSVDVKNTGTIAGDEVVQLYLHDEQSAQPRRYKDLRGFRRVPLTAGQTKTVTFNLVERDFEYYDTTQSAWVVEPGAVDVLVGASSLDIRQQGTITFY
jgi:beta-glucosidase